MSRVPTGHGRPGKSRFLKVGHRSHGKSQKVTDFHWKKDWEKSQNCLNIDRMW
jgi:hypothetical protein